MYQHEAQQAHLGIESLDRLPTIKVSQKYLTLLHIDILTKRNFEFS